MPAPAAVASLSSFLCRCLLPCMPPCCRVLIQVCPASWPTCLCWVDCCGALCVAPSSASCRTSTQHWIRQEALHVCFRVCTRPSSVCAPDLCIRIHIAIFEAVWLARRACMCQTHQPSRLTQVFVIKGVHHMNPSLKLILRFCWPAPITSPCHTGQGWTLQG